MITLPPKETMISEILNSQTHYPPDSKLYTRSQLAMQRLPISTLHLLRLIARKKETTV